MHFVVHIAPNYTENAVRFIDKFLHVEGIRPALISQEPLDWLPEHLRRRVADFRLVPDVFNAEQLTVAAQSLEGANGKIHRLTAATEQVQIAVAQVRESLGIEGMNVATVQNFRDKARMKKLLREAGIPTAKYCQAENEQSARDFCSENGYPVVAKPLDGAATQATFMVENEHDLNDALSKLAPSAAKPIILEEFIKGEEFSFDTFSIHGEPVFHSLTMYLPNPLHVVRNAWIQWQVVLPREVNESQYDDIREVAFKTLKVLGMQTGMTHLEWFRRQDGSIAISEVAARPPGAQITTMISRSCDFDSEWAWFQTQIFETFPEVHRKYAVGAAFLRGMGEGRVTAVRGLDMVKQDFGHLICDLRVPHLGQEKAKSYEGEGYLILRHPETEVVREALSRVVADVKVILGQ